jgi:hypothetical protein
MAGRGCTILVKVLGSTENGEQVEDIILPVALHSPLEVLRDQIERLTNIAIRDQVLILCDLSDPERNSDLLLDGRDHLTLRECGIRNNSILSLHALGLPAERRIDLLNVALERNRKSEIKTLNSRPISSLATPIVAANANHSYNGIIFDIESIGPNEIEVTSISIAGMLGRVVSFCC